MSILNVHPNSTVCLLHNEGETFLFLTGDMKVWAWDTQADALDFFASLFAPETDADTLHEIEVAGVVKALQPSLVTVDSMAQLMAMVHRDHRVYALGDNPKARVLGLHVKARHVDTWALGRKVA